MRKLCFFVGMDAFEVRLADIERWIADATLRGGAEGFVLEVMLANRLAMRTPGEAADFVEDICSPFRQAYSSDTAVSDQAVQEAYAGIMNYVEQITRRALLRSVQIRQLAKHADTDPL